MHIAVQGIYLEELEFRIYQENLDELNYNLKIDCKTVLIDDDKLVQFFRFNVAHEIENPPFRFKFTLSAYFSFSGDGDPSIEEFAKHHGPAYVVPYARELISNITSRTAAVPTLIIPPINIFAFIEEGRLVESDDLTISIEEKIRELESGADSDSSNEDNS